jgi:hypothetical protein
MFRTGFRFFQRRRSATTGLIIRIHILKAVPLRRTALRRCVLLRRTDCALLFTSRSFLGIEITLPSRWNVTSADNTAMNTLTKLSTPSLTVARATSRPASPKQTDQFQAKDALESLVVSQTVLPDIVSPSIFGAPKEQLMIREALNSLPFHQSTLPTSIEVQQAFADVNVMGTNRSAVGQIAMNRTGWGMSDPTNFKGNVIHEVGHSVDIHGGIVGSAHGMHPSSFAPFGQGPYVSDYAATKPAEDFAESFREFHQNPARLKELNPQKFDKIQSLEKPNFLEKLVDQPAFKETGRFIGEQLGAHAWLRTSLDVVRQVGAFVTVAGGIKQLKDGITNDDPLRAVAGGLGCAAGVGLALTFHTPLLGLAAMALLGARQEVNRGATEGESTAQTTAGAVGGGIGAVIGGTAVPLGLTEIGYHIAGPIGGTVGLAIGGLLGSHVGASLGGEFGRTVEQAV